MFVFKHPSAEYRNRAIGALDLISMRSGKDQITDQNLLIYSIMHLRRIF